MIQKMDQNAGVTAHVDGRNDYEQTENERQTMTYFFSLK